MCEPKVVLITGCDSEVGKTVAVEFAKIGYKVSISGLDEHNLDVAIAQMVEAAPISNRSNFLGTKADFTHEEQIDSVIKKTIEHFGGLNVVVNIPGANGAKYSIRDDGFYDEFQGILRVNLMGSIRLAQLAAPYLIATRGVLINLSSVLDREGNFSISCGVANAGLRMMTKTLANSLEGTGVRCLAVAPRSLIASTPSSTGEHMDFSDLMPGEDRIASLVLFLASKMASFIHGTIIEIDGSMLVKSRAL